MGANSTPGVLSVNLLRSHAERPEFFRHFQEVPPPTAHVCHCGAPATHINGYYLVGPRRVRVWVCEPHVTANALTVLPAPRHIQAALDAEEENRREMKKKYRWDVDREHGYSVKPFAPTGHGDAIPYDKTAGWRWGETNIAKNSPMREAVA